MAEAGDDGFFSRWSRRKQALRQGRPLPEPTAAADLASRPEPPRAAPAEPAPPRQPQPGAAGPAAAQPPAAEPPPTLQDVAQLTPQSDFSRFVRPDVDPQVKNAALRKLFADPHFNVMDGLDVYIDDYNTPNPLPTAMLRKMASARVLGLVQDEPQPAATAAAAATAPAASAPAAQTVAAAPQQPADGPAVAEPPSPNPGNPDHDHPNLRLQPDHAAGPQGSERNPR